MKVELFKVQIDSTKREKGLPKRKESDSKEKRICVRSLDKAYKSWMTKVENTRGHEENKIANEITIRSRIKKWINKCKTAKLLKFKEKKRKDLPNGSEEIKSWHVTFEFQIRKTSEDIGRQLPFIHNNLGEGHEENKIANEITIRSRIKKWINKCKTAKLLKFKKKKRKNLLNESEEI
ncbi:hypothetical protein C2G38_2042465 [Gigaspora rosea]|uniref:Uncharacterized protein n=1 Tax=Gigaspora rosea TaxID=44941 RepID=A0A397UVZ6_9GLOM|nr:hypothetical protein C2G38_2042465 [Gigaspora rosea]